MIQKKQLKRMLLSGVLIGTLACTSLPVYGETIGITAEEAVDTANGLTISEGDGTSATPYLYESFITINDIATAATAAGGLISNGKFAKLTSSEENPSWDLSVTAVSGSDASDTADADTASDAVGFKVTDGHFTVNGGLNIEVTSIAGAATTTGAFNSYAETLADGLNVAPNGTIIVNGNTNISIVAQSGTASSDHEAGAFIIAEGINSAGTVEIDGDVTMNFDTTAGTATSNALDPDSEKTSSSSDIVGVFANAGGTTDISGKLTIDSTIRGGSAISANDIEAKNGIYAKGINVDRSGGTINIGDDVAFTNTSTGGEARITSGAGDSFAKVEVDALNASGGSIDIAGNVTSNITATGGAATSDSGEANAGVNIAGIYAENTGNITISGNADLTATGIGGEATTSTGAADALVAVGGIANKGSGTITVEGNTTINSIATAGTQGGTPNDGEAIAWGISASSGIIDLQGDVVVTTSAISSTDSMAKTYALDATNGTININQGAGGQKVQLTGDVGFDSTGTTGKINVNFDTSDSFLKGLVNNTGTGTQANLTFSNGATWSPTGDGAITSNFGTDGTGLILDDGGVLDMAAWNLNSAGVNESNTYRDLTINGKAALNDGAVFRINTDVVGGHSDTIAFTTAPAVAGTQYIQIGYDPGIAAQLDAGATTLTPGTPLTILTGVTGSTLAGKESQIDGSLFRHDLTPTISDDGSGNISLNSISNTTATKSLSEGLRTSIDAQQSSQNAWMNQGNHMIRRLGDLRLENDDAKNGIWARVYTGSNRVKANNYGRKFDQDYTGTQLGYDRKIETSNGHFYLGGLFDYQASDASFLRGDGDIKSYGLGLYGSWVSDKGHHVDLVLRGSRIDNDYSATDINNNKIDGSYDVNAYGISVEYGYRKDLKKNFFVEPQAQLNFGHLGSGDHTLSNGVKISQDGIMTGTGRLGILLGKEFGKDVKKGNVYFQTSLIQDFSETPSMYASHNGQRVKIDSIDTKGTSFEFALGTNYKFNEKGKLYIEVSKTVNGEIDTRWQLTGGVRVKF